MRLRALFFLATAATLLASCSFQDTKLSERECGPTQPCDEGESCQGGYCVAIDQDTVVLDVPEDGDTATTDTGTDSTGDTSDADAAVLCGGVICSEALGEICCDDECVFALTTDNCGGCGQVDGGEEFICDPGEQCLDGEPPSCICEFGFEDCDAFPGCESDILFDAQNCGGCYDETENPRARCEGSDCVEGQCLCGDIVCGDDEACCEGGCVNIESDLQNCGGCGIACGTGETCEAGRCTCGTTQADISVDVEACAGEDVCCADTCVFPTDPACQCGGLASCDAGQLCCSDSCTDILTDPANCGDCENSCTGDQICRNGSCACPQSAPNLCGNACVNVLSDDNNCGACGEICAGGTTCCGGSCVDTNASELHCGGCASTGGNRCNSSELCCDATCFDIQSDPANCGRCANDCGDESVYPNVDPAGAPSCNEGACVFDCSAGYADCNTQAGCETEILSDEANCGGCGITCGGGETCCSGACVDTAVSAQNCGGCGQLCGSQCSGGVCGCPDPTTGDCDGDAGNGCETTVTEDVDNCGGCNIVCTDHTQVDSADCTDGACVYSCANDFDDCDSAVDGCETNITSDETHCGGCGNDCTDDLGVASATCEAEACVYTCTEGRDDCGPAAGCETNLLTTVTRCGDCTIDCTDTSVHVNTNDASCDTGACAYTCAANFGDCVAGAEENVSAGCETDLRDSTANCGACDNDCSAHPNVNSSGNNTCSRSACIYECQAGYGDCVAGSAEGEIGCETDLNTTATDCGACGNDCTSHTRVASATCDTGVCSYTCAEGYDDCTGTPGCETDTTSDPLNCGGCDIACGFGETCSSGTCTATTGVVLISAGSDHVLAVTGDQDLWGWGDNSSNQLVTGNGVAQKFDTAQDLAAPATVIDACAGGIRNKGFSCHVLSDNTVECKGDDSTNALGDAADSSGTLVTVFGITNAVSVACGHEHACAILDDGSAECWGKGGDGRLGNNAEDDQPTPVAVSNVSNFTKLSLGGAHSCGVTADGDLYCWGKNGDGQLGLGDTDKRIVPIKVADFDEVVDVAAGGDHSCAVTSLGGLYCWGKSDKGQTGGSGANAPQQVTRFSLAAEVDAGDKFSCVRSIGGGVFCFGDNNKNQVTGSAKSTSTPQNTGVSNAIQIDLGLEHSCALLNTRGVQCWGEAGDGQLGNASNQDTSTPQTVQGLPTP